MSPVYDVVVTELAEARLRAIGRFEWSAKSENYSKKIQATLTRGMRRLAQLPSSNPPYLLDTGPPSLRYILVANYKVIFEVLEDERTVLVLTIRSNAEDPAVILGDL